MLLAPDLLVETHQVGVLAEGLGGDDAGSGTARVVTIPVPGIGSLCCAYRTERVDGSDARDAVEGTMLDEHGRPLEILYGIACATSGTLTPHHDDLDRARAAALGTYGRFLADESGFVAERSMASPLRSTVRPPPVAPAGAGAGPWGRATPGRELPPAGRTGVVGVPVVAGVAGGLLVLAIAVMAWVVLFGASAPSVTRVRVNRPEHVVRCGRQVPVVFTASVSTDGRARVVYHWEDRYLGWRTGTSTLAFHSGGTQPVRVKPRLLVTPGRRVSGRVSLVVDSPNHRTASTSYTLACPRTLR